MVDGLTDSQRDYFSILESLDPSPEMQKSIEQAKADLAYRARRGEYERLARDKPQRRLMRRFRAWLAR
ncbi:hypothetical protein [Agrococcus sp. DT81.2]|uniref:hypothetical protein n=1 Tax=Agrococcus sp. DT81.2 TaxID=3393414 RepID=UPI003CE51F62